MTLRPFFLFGQRRPLVRDLEAEHFLELFLVAAVASVLGIRAYLELTNYPQIGGNGLHIAHVLWGGLLMLVALSILLGYSNRPVKRVAAIVGGIGFGAFIDELGKFITSDNNYFFEPTVAFMYLLFILLYLVNRVLHRDRTPTREEAMTNALELMKESVERDLDPNEQARALALLAPYRSTDQEAESLSTFIERMVTVPPPHPGFVRNWRIRLRRLYQFAVRQSWFRTVFITIFLAQSAATLAIVVSRLFATWRPELPLELSFSDWGELAGSAVSATLILIGATQLMRSRRETYEYCIRGMLVSIFITRVFLFANEQVSAVVGLGFDILILGLLRTLVEFEDQAVSENSGQEKRGQLDERPPEV